MIINYCIEASTFTTRHPRSYIIQSSDFNLIIPYYYNFKIMTNWENMVKGRCGRSNMTTHPLFTLNDAYA